MKAFRSKILKYIVTLTFCASLFAVTTSDALACEYGEVLVDCNRTALNNFEEGLIDHETLIAFQDIHCPAAAASCF